MGQYLDDLKTIYKDEIFLKAAEMAGRRADNGMCYALYSKTELNLQDYSRVKGERLCELCEGLLEEYVAPDGCKDSVTFWWPVKGDPSYKREHTERRICCLIMMHYIVGDLIKKGNLNKKQTK